MTLESQRQKGFTVWNRFKNIIAVAGGIVLLSAAVGCVADPPPPQVVACDSDQVRVGEVQNDVALDRYQKIREPDGKWRFDDTELQAILVHRGELPGSCISTSERDSRLNAARVYISQHEADLNNGRIQILQAKLDESGTVVQAFNAFNLGFCELESDNRLPAGYSFLAFESWAADQYRQLLALLVQSYDVPLNYPVRLVDWVRHSCPRTPYANRAAELNGER